MDNVTHSLIGITMGETIRRFPRFKNSSPKFRFAILWAAIIGNNIPDGDFIINRYLKGGELGYLLHHRGYTHTLIATPLLAIVTLLIAAALIGVRGFRGLSRSEWWTLFWVSLGAVCLHIGADFMNDYGVHPFAPFWPHWLYGGFIYIVEPLLIASLVPLLVFGFRSQSRFTIASGLGVLTSAVLLGLLWFTQILTWPVALANTLFLAFALWVQNRRPGVAQPLAFAASVMVVFAVMSQMAAQRVREKISQEQPEEKITQLVTTPLPGNPFCWQVIPVTRLDMEAMAGQVSGQITTPYFERLGVVSLWPSAFPPETCYFRTEVERTAPLMKASLSADAHTFWIGEFRGTVESLSASATQYCRFEQFLRWARVPFYFKMPGNVLLGGDLRYDREPELGFAEHEFHAEDPCLVHAPNWDSPSGLLRNDLQRKQ